MADDSITSEQTEYDRNDIEDEIRAEISKLSRCVQSPDSRMYELISKARSEEEMEKLKAAIELFNGDQVVVKKKMTEFQFEVSRNVEGLEQKMYGLTCESETEDLKKVEDDDVDEIPEDSDLEFSVNIEQRMCGLLSDVGEFEEFEICKSGIKGLLKEEEKDAKKKSDRSGDFTENDIYEGESYRFNNNRAENEIFTNIEGLEEEMYELMRENGGSKEAVEIPRTGFEGNCVKTKLIQKLREFDEVKNEECEEAALELMSHRIAELELEISSMLVDIVNLMIEKDEAVEKFQRLRSELPDLNYTNIEREFEAVEQMKRKAIDLLQPSDRELRDRIESLLNSQAKKTKAKMDEESELQKRDRSD